MYGFTGMKATVLAIVLTLYITRDKGFFHLEKIHSCC